WYKKQRFQGSTEQTNKNNAKLVEAKIRSDTALANRGIAPPKPSPTLKDFLEGPFLQDVAQYVKARRTKTFYAQKVQRILEYKPWVDLPIPECADWIPNFVDARRRRVGIITVNGELRTLRKAFLLALERGWISRKIKVRLLPGERGRTFTVSTDLERE